MIFEFFINIFVTFLEGIITSISSLPFLSIPVDSAYAIAKISVYGSWIVGADLMVVFGACVFFWTSVKLTAGLVLFVWRLLPLT